MPANTTTTMVNLFARRSYERHTEYTEAYIRRVISHIHYLAGNSVTRFSDLTRSEIKGA